VAGSAPDFFWQRFSNNDIWNICKKTCLLDFVCVFSPLFCRFCTLYTVVHLLQMLLCFTTCFALRGLGGVSAKWGTSRKRDVEHLHIKQETHWNSLGPLQSSLDPPVNFVLGISCFIFRCT
jgi:hypothetical protein